METPLITFEGVTLGYGRKVVLRDITFSIFQTDYIGLVGPNGAGKTTILRAILGSLKPQAGTIRLLPAGAAPIRFGYVPQRDTIDDILPYTAAEVVLMGRYRQIGLFRRPQKEDHEIVRRSLDHVGIAELGDRWFKDLSGGQKQRVLIARALATQPDVLILDEPTNGMDLSSRTSILELIQGLHDVDGLTVIMVSHMLDDVANQVRRIMIVERNAFQVGDVSDVLTGENLSALYGIPVDVQTLKGNTVILPGGRHGNA